MKRSDVQASLKKLYNEIRGRCHLVGEQNQGHSVVEFWHESTYRGKVYRVTIDNAGIFSIATFALENEKLDARIY